MAAATNIPPPESRTFRRDMPACRPDAARPFSVLITCFHVLLSYALISSDSILSSFQLERESKVNRIAGKIAGDMAGHYELPIHLFARERLAGRAILCKSIRHTIV